ncbi:MAG: gliding motility-associated C-terminal domain-containing protein [Bacteroidetes bacterium]|nr:gliding motility-associated C-terminal domain-containing protein [Bacteroidota bacterium]
MTFGRAHFFNTTLLVLLLASSSVALSRNFYWINNAGNWNDPSHWSSYSGGGSCGEIPGPDDAVYFDAASFTTYFPIVTLSNSVEVKSLYFESDFNPVLQAENVTLTITETLNATARYGVEISGSGYLHFLNQTASEKFINTSGIQLNTNVVFDGKWALADHFLTTNTNLISIASGSLKTNGYTLYADQIEARENQVDLDFSGSHIYAHSALNLDKAENTGSAAFFHTTDGTFSNSDKSKFTGSDWIKTTVNCPNPPFTLTLTVTSNYNGSEISCNDSCDGILTIVAGGTPGPFSYSFNSGFGPFTSQTVYPDLCAGTYTITVKDSSQQIVPGLYAQCSVSEIVDEPPILIFDPPFVIQPTCPDICDGQAFSFPSGGTGVITVFWPNSGETTANPVGLCTGDNPVHVSDENGCFIDDIVTIMNPPAIMPNEVITPPSCNGSCDAEILLAPSGGNGGPYTYSWSPIPTVSGQGSNPAIGFCAITVDVSIFDQDGCQKDTSFTIINPPILSVTAAFVSNALCFGSCDGQASSSPAGGSGGFTFEWFDNATGLTTGITDEDPTTLCAGSYYVIVTDASGCTAQSNVIVIGEPTALTATAAAYDVSCFGVCDGSVDVDVFGGIPGYSYSWTTVPGGSGAGATDSLSGLCPGQYQIDATDANGCAIVPIVVEVFEPAPVTLDLTVSTPPTCYDLCDGIATVVAGGGVSPFTYNWSPAPGAGQGTPNATAMCDGTYTLTATDDNGCFLDTTFTLNNPAFYDITSSQTNLLCFGNTDGSATVTVNSGGSGAGYTYTWAPVPPVGQGTPTASGLSAGIYSVTISDPLLCDTIISFTITSPPQLTATASVISQVSCFNACDGSAQVVIAGGSPGYSVLWDDPAAQTTLVASGLCDGTYNVDITDLNGCTATDNIIITEPGPFVLDTSWINVLCYNACSATATVTMLSGGVPPYLIQWDDPLNQTTFTAFNLCAGTWTAVVTDQNLCDTIIPFTITEPLELIVSINSTISSCFGDCSGSADVIASGGTGALAYQWYNASTGLPVAGQTNPAAANLCPGDYYCIVTDQNGCTTQSATVTITELPQITTSILSITDATCGVCDGAAQVSAAGGAGGFTFTWVPAPGTGQGTDNVTGLCAGVSAVNIVDAAGCIANIAIPINSISIEVLTLDSVDVSCFGLCDGQAIATYTSIDPPYTLEWFDNNTGLTTGIIDNPASNPSTATGLCDGDYLAVLTNNTGCVTTGVVTINEPTQITATLTPTNVLCNGDCNGTIDAVAAGGAGGYSYNWAPAPGGGQGTPNASGLCDGNYTLTVTDLNGCSQPFVGTISEPVQVSINSTTSTDISCFGANDGTANVAASGGIPPLSYEWFDCNTGLTTGITTPLASNLGPGVYQVVVSDANGCSATGPCLPVIEPPALTATINTSNVNCYGTCDGLIDAAGAGGTAPYFYQWQDEFGVALPGQTNDTMNNVCQGIYNVVVTDFEGCSITFGPIDMTAPASPWIVTTASTDPTCSGSCDGTATVTVLGGNNPPYSYQWDDPFLQVVPGATNLCAGTWTVVISDAGICDTTISFTLIGAQAIMANATVTDILCFADATGAVSTNPSGGTIPYTITWSDGQLGANAVNLPAGPITVSITDGNGCTKDTTITLTQPPQLVVNSSFSNNSTCGVCNASATVNIVGGVPGYTYDWSPDPAAGEGTNNATGLCPGVVTCTVTDQNSCVLIQSFPVSDINGEILTPTFTDASCFGACDGTADAAYVCGDPACTQEWFDASTGLSTGVTTSTITNLCAGDYFVEVLNNSLCISVGNVTISSPAQIIDNAVLVPVTCNNDTDGSITVAPTGGSGAGYTYFWTPVPSNGQGTNQALNIGSGTWSVDITDSDGCTETYTYDVINPTPITITATPTDPTCAVACNGTISIVVSGGYGGYTYQWTTGGAPIPGETGPLIANLCSGNYNIDVTDLNGCLVNMAADVTLSEPVPVSSPISGTDGLCFGDCSGTATVVPSGGFPPYLINWYDSGTGSLIGQTGTVATNLCTGVYFAVITDNNGCNFTTPDQTINEPTQLTNVLTLTDASCFGFCDGTGDLALAGGTIPYTYEWLDIMGNPIVGGTNATVNNMCEGNYTVEGTDANGCSTGVMFAVINGFPEITANVFSNNANCGVADGNATVFANGGNPPFTYQWMDNLMVPIAGQTSSILANAFAGTYFVSVTDQNGCSQVFQADISNFSSTTITWDSVIDPSCTGSADGSISITVNSLNPPLLYTWNPGGIIAEDPTGLVAGIYTVQVTDASGCINFFSTTLTDPAPITITPSSTPSDCGQCNGTITIVPAGGTGALSTIWNNGLVGNSISGLCSGVYQAQVTDANGCMLIEPVDVTNTGGLIGDLVITAITCAGGCDGQAVVSGTGGTAPYSYAWLHDGSTSDTQTNLCAGTYFVTVTDATGCSVNIQVDMLDPNPITATATITNPDCLASNGSISVLTANGNLPHTYQWNTGPITPAIGGIPAGVYTLTVTDASGCTMDFVYGVNNANAAAISLVTTNVSCYNACDGTIDTLSLTGGTAAFTFDWLDNTGTSLGVSTPLITALCDNDYILQVTDAMGCLSFQSATITQPDTILTNPLFQINPTCNAACDGQIVSNPIGGTLPFSFAWNDPASQTTFTATNLCAGPYDVLITDANGCQVSQSGSLTEPTAITITVNSVTDATCLNATDGAVDITASGGTPGYTYEWISQTLADTTLLEDLSNILPMNYYLTVTDANGCIAQDTIGVDTTLSVIANAGPDAFICFNDTLTLIGSSNIPAGALYNWYDSTGTFLIDTTLLSLPPVAAGSTSFIFEVSFGGCSHTDTVAITMNGQLTVDAGPDIDLYPTQTGTIGGAPTTSASNTVLWSPSTYLSGTTVFNPTVMLPQVSTMYYVTATDSNGCTVTDSMYVEVLPEIIIPDGISPDGNNLNDTWILDFLDQYPGVSIKINVYNRWGELLFESDENYDDDWGGTTKDGKRLPAGTYYYVIDIDHPDFPEPFTGPITVMW